MTVAPRPGRSDRRRPSLPTLVARAVRDDGVFARGDLVLVAVSGGPDSNALLHVLARTRERLGHRLIACGVDHGLRTEAVAELACAAALAAGLDVPFEVVRVEVGSGGNLQARARTARHAALREVAARHGADVVATGHTADDRAETVLSRLLRGAGPGGLAVLPPRDGPLCRPLVRALRSDVEAYVARHAIPCSTDPSNADPRFQRVRIRHEILPLLRSMAPRIVWSLCDLADALAAARDAHDPAAGLNAAQRKAVARARANGRTEARLLVRGGREVVARFVTPETADPTSGGSTESPRDDAEAPRAAGDKRTISQFGAFPVDARILMQEDVRAAGHRRRRRP